jgi:hypothetical protein
VVWTAVAAWESFLEHTAVVMAEAATVADWAAERERAERVAEKVVARVLVRAGAATDTAERVEEVKVEVAQVVT